MVTFYSGVWCGPVVLHHILTHWFYYSLEYTCVHTPVDKSGTPVDRLEIDTPVYESFIPVYRYK